MGDRARHHLYPESWDLPDQELRRKRTEYETALFASNTYAPRGGECTLKVIQVTLKQMSVGFRASTQPTAL